MSSLHAPRPFSTLGVKPFLFAQTQELEAIQKEYFRLSRKYHPDLFQNANDDQKAMQEAAAAQLNTDYARLKDFWKLTESVVHGAKIPQTSNRAAGAPPDLASDYFELQELWAEKGAQDPAVKSEAQSFLKKITGKLSESEALVIEFAKRYPYQGLGDAVPPWNEKDLENLNKLLQQLRYFRSFSKDIEQKFT